MRMKTTAAMMLLAAGINVPAAQAEPVHGGGGTLEITGQIIQPPCSISEDSTKQQLEMGAVSSSLINGGKVGRKVPFKIELVDCTKDTNVQVTIKGMPDRADDKLLALSGGTSTGAGIAFFDSNDTQLELNKASEKIKVVKDKFTLQLTAALKGNKPNSVAEPGDFNSTATFLLEYD